MRPALDHLLDRLVRLVISRAETVVGLVDGVPRVGALSGDSLVCRQFLQCSLGRIQTGLGGQLPGVHAKWCHVCIDLVSSNLLVLHTCRRVDYSRRIDRSRALRVRRVLVVPEDRVVASAVNDVATVGTHVLDALVPLEAGAAAQRAVAVHVDSLVRLINRAAVAVAPGLEHGDWPDGVLASLRAAGRSPKQAVRHIFAFADLWNA